MSRAKRSGRPTLLTTAEWDRVLGAKEVNERRNLRRWAMAAGVPTSTLHSWVTKMEVKKQMQWLRPSLNDAQKLARLKYVVGQVVDIDARHPKFKSLKGRAYIDEKWFYLMQNGKGVWAAPGEEAPVPRTVRHKSHIPKAMFIVMVTLPDHELNFSGKVAMHCCTEMVEAARASKNRGRGDLEEKDVPVTAEYYRHVMKTYMVPSFKKCVREARLGGAKLVVQHDGAKPHTGKGNNEYWPVMLQTLCPNLAVEVVTQPAQSPDLNVLDMGFFNSLQCLADETDPDSLSDLLSNVEDIFWEEYPAETLMQVFNTQYDVYNAILAKEGGNDYDLNEYRGYKRDASGREKPRNTVHVGALRNVLRKYPELA